MSRKLNLPTTFLVAFPGGLRKYVGPGLVDESELPESFVLGNPQFIDGVAEVEPPASLPADFPGGAALTHAGHKTLDDVMALTDEQLLAVEGIGQQTLAAIQAALGRAPDAAVGEPAQEAVVDEAAEVEEPFEAPPTTGRRGKK